jgi:hypothetical protein
MKFRHLRLSFACLALALGTGLALHAAEGPATLAGTWTLDVARSTPIRPWDKQSMTIAVTGDTVVLTRHLAWGADRKVSDTTTVKTDGKTSTANPVGYWLDTWYTNVYVGGDHQKHVTAEWLDGGRVLRLETNLQLEAQQGDHPVHLYDEYRLSADGRTLKLFELRSTRDEPLVYLYTRQ